MQNTATYVGVDVSSDTLDIAAHPRRQAKHFRNNDGGINEAVTYLKGLAPVLVVMEATGGLEMSVAAALGASGIPVAVVNPRQVRDYAGPSERASPSRLDASASGL